MQAAAAMHSIVSLSCFSGKKINKMLACVQHFPSQVCDGDLGDGGVGAPLLSQPLLEAVAAGGLSDPCPSENRKST